jgi:hypothetical protein
MAIGLVTSGDLCDISDSFSGGIGCPGIIQERLQLRRRICGDGRANIRCLIHLLLWYGMCMLYQDKMGMNE